MPNEATAAIALSAKQWVIARRMVAFYFAASRTMSLNWDMTISLNSGGSFSMSACKSWSHGSIVCGLAAGVPWGKVFSAN